MAKVLLKTGVEPRNLYIFAAIANVAAGLKEPVSVTITAGVDGNHKTGSAHYRLAALDVRSHDFPAIAKDLFVKAVLARLGKDYQGFVELAGTPGEHFHFEHDPE